MHTCSKCSGDLPGGFHKSERGTQRGKEVSCFLETGFKLDDLFLQRKINKAVSVQAHGSKQANRDFFLNLYIIIEIIHYFFFIWELKCSPGSTISKIEHG